MLKYLKVRLDPATQSILILLRIKGCHKYSQSVFHCLLVGGTIRVLDVLPRLVCLLFGLNEVPHGNIDRFTQVCRDVWREPIVCSGQVFWGSNNLGRGQTPPRCPQPHPKCKTRSLFDSSVRASSTFSLIWFLTGSWRTWKYIKGHGGVSESRIRYCESTSIVLGLDSNGRPW